MRRGAPGEDTGGSRLDADGTVDRRWLSGDVGCRATSRGTPSLCDERVGSSSSLTGGDCTSPSPLLSLPSCLGSPRFPRSSEPSEVLPPTPAAAGSTVAAPAADTELVVPAEKPTASPAALTLDRAVSEGLPAGAMVSAWATPVNTLSALRTQRHNMRTRLVVKYRTRTSHERTSQPACNLPYVLIGRSADLMAVSTRHRGAWR